MKEKLNVAVAQLTSLPSISSNIENVLSLLQKIDLNTTDLVCFPENSLFFRVVEGSRPEVLEEDDKRWEPLKAISKETKTWIHLVTPVKINESVFNSVVLFDNSGGMSFPYQKIHLFDVDLEGKPPIRESDAFERGKLDHTFDIKGWKIGSSICFDLRFPEFFTIYYKQKVDLLLNPSAFTVPTGKAHWEVLLRARAIEGQCYMIAAAQVGSHGLGKSTYGHSLVIDPWGVVLSDSGEQEGVKTIDLDYDKVIKTRNQVPLFTSRPFL